MNPTLVFVLIFGAVTGIIWFLWSRQVQISRQIEEDRRARGEDPAGILPVDSAPPPMVDDTQPAPPSPDGPTGPGT